LFVLEKHKISLPVATETLHKWRHGSWYIPKDSAARYQSLSCLCSKICLGKVELIVGELH